MKVEDKMDFSNIIKEKEIKKCDNMAIISFNKIKEKPKFKDRFDRAPKFLQDLFIEFVNKINELGIENYATNTPDYRLKRGNIFAIIDFLPAKSALKIAIKYMGIELKSEVLYIRRKSVASQTAGVYKDFYEVEIKTIDELNEIIKIINLVKNNA